MAGTLAYRFLVPVFVWQCCTSALWPHQHTSINSHHHSHGCDGIRPSATKLCNVFPFDTPHVPCCSSQQVHKISGIGCVVCGKVEAGSIAEGSKVVLAPQGIIATVKSIETQQTTVRSARCSAGTAGTGRSDDFASSSVGVAVDHGTCAQTAAVAGGCKRDCERGSAAVPCCLQVDQACAGDSVGISLKGVSIEEVCRGMVVLPYEGHGQLIQVRGGMRYSTEVGCKPPGAR